MECLLEEGDAVGAGGEGEEDEEDAEFAVSMGEGGEVTVKEVKKVGCCLRLFAPHMFETLLRSRNSHCVAIRNCGR